MEHHLRVFKSAWFHKFAKKEKISDATLCETVKLTKQGQIDADLGSGLLKQRVARSGGGKSGGYRTLVFFRSGTRAIFAFGFAKSNRANISETETAAFRKAAKLVLNFTDKQIDAEVSSGRMIEVHCND